VSLNAIVTVTVTYCCNLQTVTAYCVLPAAGICTRVGLTFNRLRRHLSVCASPLVLKESLQRNRLAWPHRRRGLASDGVRYAGARSSVGRRFRSVAKLRLEWYGGVFVLLQQRSKPPREVVMMPKASTSLLTGCETDGWPLQDSVSLRGCCARISHPLIALLHLYCAQYCNTIARLLSVVQYNTPAHRPPFCTSYTLYKIGDGNIV